MTPSFALFLIAQVPIASPPPCRGAVASITTLVAQKSRNADDPDPYTLTILVSNVGSQDQAQSVVQSLEIVLDKTAVAEKPIPPLAVGKSYTWSYPVPRTQLSQSGKTNALLLLVLPGRIPASPGACKIANTTYRAKF